MDFKQLNTFLTVVNCGSFTKAADKLYLSQPTISAHISALERELNKKLIARTTKRVEVTHDGMILLEYAKKLLQIKENMLEALSDSEKKAIHIGASTTPSAYILPKLLPGYLKQHSNVRFTVSQGDSRSVAEGLTEGIMDIGLIGIQPQNDSLISVPFCRDRLILITPVNEYFLSLRDRSIQPDFISIFNNNPIITRELGSATRKSSENVLSELGIAADSLKIAAELNDCEAISRMVAGGLGIAIVSEFAIDDRSHDLLSFELPVESANRELYLIYRTNEQFKPIVRDFISYLLQ